MSTIDQRRIVSTDSPGMRRIVEAVSGSVEPLDGHQIAARAHVAFNTFQNQYRHMLLSAGLIHVAGWKHNTRGPFVPVYGVGPSAKTTPVKPQKIDHRARSRNWKDRTGYNEARKAHRRLARPPDMALAALLGLPSRYSKGTGTA